jgi:hypothetical protein
MKKRSRYRHNPVTGSGVLGLAVVGAAGIVLYMLYKNRSALAASVNPANPANIINRGANALLQTVTGNKIDTIGTSVANVFPSAAEKAVNAMVGPVVPAGVPSSVPAPSVAPPTVFYSGTPVDQSAPVDSTGADALMTMQPYMQGLGDLRAGGAASRVPNSARIRLFGHQTHR